MRTQYSNTWLIVLLSVLIEAVAINGQAEPLNVKSACLAQRITPFASR